VVKPVFVKMIGFPLPEKDKVGSNPRAGDFLLVDYKTAFHSTKNIFSGKVWE